LFHSAWLICLVDFCLSGFSSRAGFTVQGVNPFPSLQFGSRIITADFNNDGKLDILYQAGNTSGTDFSLQLGNGDGTFQAPINKPSGSAFTSGPLTGINFTQLTAGVVAVDLNGDGRVDLIDAQAAAVPLVYLNTGSGFTAVSSPFPLQTFTGRMVFGDFNHDGYMDVLNQPGNTSSTGITLYQNNANGSISFTAIVKPDLSAFTTGPFNGVNFTQISTTTVYPVDLNGDGKVDLIDNQGASANPIVYQNTGSGYTTVTNPFPAQAFTGRFVFGDFNADGYVDVLNQSGNTSGTGITLYQNNANGTIAFTAIAKPAASAFTSGPFSGVDFTQLTAANFLAADWNNDGAVDLVDSQNTASRYIVQSSPPKLSSSIPANNATGVSITTSIALTFDQAVSKGSTGNITLKKASDNSTVASITVTSGSVTGGGTAWTVATGVTLANSTTYYVLIDKATFVNAGGAIYKGITNATALAFTTVAPPPPTITSSLTASGTYQIPISTYTILATGSPAGFGAGGLPSGLSVNTTNGQITGTPLQSGIFNVTLSATNGGGSATATLVFSIAKASATVSLNRSVQLFDGHAKTVTATTLPAGLTVSLTYNGGSAAPTNTGAYQVIGTVSDPNYTGSGTNFLYVAGPPEILTAKANPPVPGNVVFTWSALPSVNYQVQATAQLAPAIWTNLAGQVLATNSIMTNSNAISLAQPHGFYRVKLLLE
jgi:hypothetical protein